ncbi:MAG: Na(+)-translocating NADH-quinone reductase subunit A [FCB group bacterium]|nr:Na(+)-translocating NADH-quinone reductase subunit A [FCB group bacterium]
MAHIVIKKGHTIRISGQPRKEIEILSPPGSVALTPSQFRYVKPKLLVREGDSVRRGDPLFFDKLETRVRWASPGGGTVSRIVYGPRRRLDAVIIELEKDESVVTGPAFDADKLTSLGRDRVISTLLEAGCWPLLRQRPFTKIASPDDTPKSIFVSVAPTAPLSPDSDIVIQGREADFQAGLDVLTNLTAGKVHLVRSQLSTAAIFSQAKNVELHTVEGPHPAGNVGVQIHHIDPIKPGDVVWTVTLQHVILLGHLFLSGQVDPEIVITLGGPGASDPVHVKTRMGLPISTLTDGRLKTGEQRLISGDPLTGTAKDSDQFLNYYDFALTVLPVSHERPFFGWLRWGSPATKYTLTGAYRSNRQGTYEFSTLQNGDPRALVPIGAWEKVLPMNIWPNPLFRAILANDVEEMENLGLLELDEEDVALCSFACPSKIDLGATVRKGLDVLFKEG